MAPTRVAIIGGGVTGLAAAYELTKAGRRPLIIEAGGRLGGVIQTESVEGCVLEAGPDSFLSAKPAAFDLIQELGLAPEVIGSNDHSRVTYLVRNGRLAPMPDGLFMMVPTRILPMAATRLLSWPTKLRMGLEYFRRPNRSTPPDRSVAEFIQDHYGAEAVSRREVATALRGVFEKQAGVVDVDDSSIGSPLMTLEERQEHQRQHRACQNALFHWLPPAGVCAIASRSNK